MKNNGFLLVVCKLAVAHMIVRPVLTHLYTSVFVSIAMMTDIMCR